MNPTKRWTPDAVEELRVLRMERSIVACAVHYGVSPSRIQQVMHKAMLDAYHVAYKEIIALDLPPHAELADLRAARKRIAHHYGIRK
jgi:hypothetical protein